MDRNGIDGIDGSSLGGETGQQKVENLWVDPFFFRKKFVACKGHQNGRELGNDLFLENDILKYRQGEEAEWWRRKVGGIPFRSHFSPLSTWCCCPLRFQIIRARHSSLQHRTVFLFHLFLFFFFIFVLSFLFVDWTIWFVSHLNIKRKRRRRRLWLHSCLWRGTPDVFWREKKVGGEILRGGEKC